MCQMNPLIGPVLNQRALFAVKKFWVSVIGWTAVAQSTLASKTIIVCNCLIISAMDAVGISIASLLFLKLANPGLFFLFSRPKEEVFLSYSLLSFISLGLHWVLIPSSPKCFLFKEKGIEQSKRAKLRNRRQQYQN